MFFLITKKTIIYIIIAIFVIAISIPAIVITSAKSSVSPITIVIDAGHGGIDTGVKGINTGVNESDLNLKVALKLGKTLEDAGYKVILTRTNKGGLYNLSTKGFKKRDMNKRKSIIERANATYVVSIHMNYYTEAYRRGAQVFYSTLMSRNFAENMQDILNDYLNNPIIDKELSSLKGEYFINQCTAAPSIIIECGFLSNPEDEKLLISETYQDELTYTILSGIVAHLNYSS